MLPEPSEHHVGPTEGTGVRVYDVLVGINSTSWGLGTSVPDLQQVRLQDGKKGRYETCD